MRKALVAIAALLAFAPCFAVRIYYGPGLVQCLAPNGDAATSNWTITGAATGWDAINDPPDAACLYLTATDGDTTKIVGPASTTCSDTFDLTNTSGLSGYTIDYVTASYVCVKSSGAGGPSITTYLRVSGVDYSLGTFTCSGTNYTFPEYSSLTRYYTNPATGVAWTTSDIDALQLKIDRSNSSARIANITALQGIVVYEPSANYGTARERSGGGN